MHVESHTEYTEEQAKLADTLAFVGQEILDNTPPIIYSTNRRSHRNLLGIERERLERMKYIRQEPYFGRVDIEDQDNDREPLYVGKHALPSKGIYSWADNLAAELYYSQSVVVGKSTLLLRRTLRIEYDQLQDIRDEFIHAKLAKALGDLSSRFTDSLLLELLRENRRGQLHDIVATIQAQQYRIISAKPDQLLIVQGAPGSGKTSMALHRLAYLLYQHKDKLRPANMLVLGPNPMFLGYIANILPSLGERKIPHRTFDAWILEQLGTTVEYEPQETSLELLLGAKTSPVDKVMQYRNAQTKGSLKMAMLLDRYVAVMRDEVLTGRRPLTVRSSARLGSQRHEEVMRTVNQLTVELDRSAHLPLNQRRDALEEWLVRDISGDLFVKLRAGVRNDEANENHIKGEVTRQIHEYFDGWNVFNVSVAYRRLLRTPDLLRRVGAGIFSEWDLELLTQDAPTAQTPFRFSDLAALLYLKLRLDGRANKTYDHIVIDEAQDITPLHFRVLFEFSRDASMTVLGDLAQGIYSHHGISDWHDLELAVNGEVQIEHIQQSYRSTDAIVEYGNEVLRRLGVPLESLACHIGRAGIEVDRHPLPTNNRFIRLEMFETIIAQRRSEGYVSIALICKTAAACLRLALDFARQDVIIDGLQVIKHRTDSYAGGLVLIPAYLTKGLEFDSVILADADEISYPSDDMHGRLLYVAITRASHTLDICWQGTCSPLIDPAIDQPTSRPFLDGQLAHQPMTIGEYAAGNPQLNADWCVERLAAADRLRLLQAGKIDATVLAIMLRTAQSGNHSSDIEGSVTPLTPTERSALRERTQIIERQQGVGDAITLTQLIYGLMRHHVRSSGLTALADGDTDFTGETALLIPLARAVREQIFTFNAGRWTTRERALQAVELQYRPRAKQLLDVLSNFGIVEQQHQGNREQIRVLQAWIAGLLDLALGRVPEQWDHDLLAQLPTLPELLDANASALIEAE